MNPQLHEDMTNALEELRYDDDARVLVITGAGDSFCAGMDLKEVFHALKDQPARYDKVVRLATEWRGRTLRYFPKPTIAMVNGYCFGGAFSIVEGCDLAIAADEATFGLSEINFKGFPGRRGEQVARQSAAPAGRACSTRSPAAVSAARSRPRSGWSTSRCRSPSLKTETMAVAQDIAGKDPSALKATKDSYRFSLEMTWEASMNYTDAKEDELAAHQAARRTGRTRASATSWRASSSPGLADTRPSRNSCRTEAEAPDDPSDLWP